MPGGPTAWTSHQMQARIARRYARERRFRLLGLLAIGLAMGFLLLLLVSIAWRGAGGFFQAKLALDIHLDEGVIGVSPAAAASPEGRDKVFAADYGRLIREALMARFPGVSGRADIRALAGLVSNGARQALRDAVMETPDLIGQTQTFWLLASDDVDQYIKGNISAALPESDRRLSDKELSWIESLRSDGRVKTVFHVPFFTGSDSREPELVGIWGAIKGSFLTLLVTLIIAFPIGLASALYLEEFAPLNRMTDFIEVNINNLAAVPSIVFGLLGLAVFLNSFGLPRSAPLVGGLTLALMTLPTIIIAARAAIKAVPPSIRAAAMGVGASPLQVVFHHVLPLALPGIMTGTIIGMARALGETAPLLMIGMVAFVADVPHGFADPATVLPVQIYIWSDSPERAFLAKVSAAILVLLVFLIAMNGLAVYVRNKFEKLW
ncbi:MAG: phosphate ABC transporter permease PstA [Pseudomonadota bacterium]